MTDDFNIRHQRRIRRLSRPVRHALYDFHRAHDRRHRITSEEYISRAHAVVFGSLNSRGLTELQVFREGVNAPWDEVKSLRPLSSRRFDDHGITHRGRCTGFITTYMHPKEDTSMTNDNATDKPLQPYVLVERSVFDRLFAALSKHDRIGRPENAHDAIAAALDLRAKIKKSNGDSPIEGADVVCADEPEACGCGRADDERLNDTRYVPVPVEAVKALANQRRDRLTTINKDDALRKADTAYMRAADNLLEAAGEDAL